MSLGIKASILDMYLQSGEAKVSLHPRIPLSTLQATSADSQLYRKGLLSVRLIA